MSFEDPVIRRETRGAQANTPPMHPTVHTRNHTLYVIDQPQRFSCLIRVCCGWTLSYTSREGVEESPEGGTPDRRQRHFKLEVERCVAAASAPRPMSFPIINELWQSFHTVLQVQARRLVEDIAKENKADPKELWRLVSATLKTPLVDADLPDPLPVTCPALLSRSEGAVRLRCRAPCVLGFSTCAQHTSYTKDAELTEPTVRRFIDTASGSVYFIHADEIVYDVNGEPRGYVKDGDVFLCAEAATDDE